LAPFKNGKLRCKVSVNSEALLASRMVFVCFVEVSKMNPHKINVNFAPTLDQLQNYGESSSIPSPEEGARLIKAFWHVGKPALRDAIIRLVEEISSAKFTELGDQPVAISSERESVN
jgi:hypothetical protein